MPRSTLNALPDSLLRKPTIGGPLEWVSIHLTLAGFSLHSDYRCNTSGGRDEWRSPSDRKYSVLLASMRSNLLPSSYVVYAPFQRHSKTLLPRGPTASMVNSLLRVTIQASRSIPPKMWSA